jgi:ABC-2 type transport system permease protein
MINTVRSEILKMQSTPGTWVVLLLAVPLTVLGMLIAFGMAGSHVGKSFSFVATLNQRRELLGAGYAALQFIAPIIGVLCVTSEYRHKTMTTTLVLTPQRSRVLGAKVVATIYLSVIMALIGLVTVLVIGLPWNSGMGGAASQVINQFGAVVPGLFASAILLGLLGLGFGTLVKNQIAGILVIIAITFIFEGLLVFLAHLIFHYDLNWLPTDASAALVGATSRAGFGGGGGDSSLGFHLLSWWAGGLAMLGWGLIPLTIGYFTTFRRDVT